MKIKNIRLINFRNYENLNLPIEKNVNIFIGKNAQGKTNLLEAIYLAASGNSFRTNRDRELLSFNRNPGYVAVDFLSRERERLIEVRLDVLKAKRIKLNRQEIKRLKDLNSGLNVVLFSPDDLELVKGSPGIRRSYLDRSISQIRPVYKHSLSRYNKILYQRNNLLKSKRPNNRDLGLLDVFNMQLVEAGTEIMLYRLEFLENLRGIGLIIVEHRALYAMSSGEKEAHLLGVSVRRTKRRLFIATSCLTGAAVAMSGMIGFVGLVVPHMTRLMMNRSFGGELPLVAIGGATFLMMTDTIARTIVRPEELPLGVVTALVGAPLFGYLLVRTMKGGR